MSPAETLDQFQREGTMPAEVRAALHELFEVIARERRRCDDMLANRAMNLPDAVHLEAFVMSMALIKASLDELVVGPEDYEA
jgi:hypothetical protein